MTSNRLPGKILKPICFPEGTPILEQVVRRVQKADRIDQVIIATTDHPTDDPVEELAVSLGAGIFRGSELDVLDRFYGAAKTYGLDQIVRITSDCPFLDPDVISRLVKLHQDGEYQYSSNCIRRTFPHGMDCEILNADVLYWMHENAQDQFYREHVTSYVTSHQEEFQIGSLTDTEDNSQIRVTVDTAEDYLLSCMLNDLVRVSEAPLSYQTIVRLFKERPYLSSINSGILQKKRYDSEKEEIEAAVQLLTKQEMFAAAERLRKEQG